MFTGIVAAVGQIESISPLAEHYGLRLRIQAGHMPLADVALGDSIAINGACMTVVDKGDAHFDIDVSKESLQRTVGLDRLGPVNLEKALSLSQVLGGHLVSGHIDGHGHVAEFEAVGESWHLAIDAPLSLARFFAYKGSVAVQGVSLTVNRIEDKADGCLVFINLIPHTYQNTALHALTAGAKVNLEIDLIARYVERMLGQTMLLHVIEDIAARPIQQRPQRPALAHRIQGLHPTAMVGLLAADTAGPAGHPQVGEGRIQRFHLAEPVVSLQVCGIVTFPK
ncbi:MAG: riboflavin synthase, partial [Betaproteobacteria bacterium]|nr:riboflavin synthase [Betaproteobacteria bacterium]